MTNARYYNFKNLHQSDAKYIASLLIQMMAVSELEECYGEMCKEMSGYDAKEMQLRREGVLEAVTLMSDIIQRMIVDIIDSYEHNVDSIDTDNWLCGFNEYLNEMGCVYGNC